MSREPVRRWTVPGFPLQYQIQMNARGRFLKKWLLLRVIFTKSISRYVCTCFLEIINRTKIAIFLIWRVPHKVATYMRRRMSQVARSLGSEPTVFHNSYTTGQSENSRYLWQVANGLHPIRLPALMDLYIHPLYVLVSKILLSILNSSAPIHLLYHPLSTISTIGPTCHFI
jgi:hypothetical protein